MLMLQTLLSERFKLVFHRETRQLPIYVMTVGSSGTGPQLVPHSGDSKCIDPESGKVAPQPGPGEPLPAYCGGFFMNPRPGDLRETGNRITMAMLVPFLAQSVDRMVRDQTGLSGFFDFMLEFAPEFGPGAQPAPSNGVSSPPKPQSIFTALQQQLGLKLELQQSPVEVFVIDSAEKPSEVENSRTSTDQQIIEDDLDQPGKSASTITLRHRSR